MARMDPRVAIGNIKWLYNDKSLSAANAIFGF